MSYLPKELLDNGHDEQEQEVLGASVGQELPLWSCEIILSPPYVAHTCGKKNYPHEETTYILSVRYRGFLRAAWTTPETLPDTIGFLEDELDKIKDEKQE